MNNTLGELHLSTVDKAIVGLYKDHYNKKPNMKNFIALVNINKII